jgi:hypothetical protein
MATSSRSRRGTQAPTAPLGETGRAAPPQLALGWGCLLPLSGKRRPPRNGHGPFSGRADADRPQGGGRWSRAPRSGARRQPLTSAGAQPLKAQTTTHTSLTFVTDALSRVIRRSCAGSRLSGREVVTQLMVNPPVAPPPARALSHGAVAGGRRRGWPSDDLR